jgi:hypothetical protein
LEFVLLRIGTGEDRSDEDTANGSTSMPSREIQFQLDAAGQEWIRMRFTTVRG